MKRKTTSEFIEEAIKVHGHKYDYTKTDLEHRDEKGRVCIICPKHGEFWQLPEKHIKRKQGCRKCKFNDWNTETIIEEFRKKYGDKYDYSKVEYKGYHEKVVNICHKKDVFGVEHGEFEITPANFLSGKECKNCKKDYLRKLFSFSNEEFIEKARKIHGDKYDYSKVEYIKNDIEVCIICPKHGEFWQTPANHLQGNGCRKCSCEKTHDKQRKSTEQFIKDAKRIHGDKYDYSKVEYKGNKINVKIICPTHGEFEQSPGSHLNGRGCRLCNESHLEREINDFLKNRKLTYYREKRFDWLGNKSIDFYLNDLNIGIECQGKQHFYPMKFFDKYDTFEDRHNRDIRKKQLCEEHGIKLYYFSHEKYDEFLGEKVYHDADELIKEIIN